MKKYNKIRVEKIYPEYYRDEMEDFDTLTVDDFVNIVLEDYYRIQDGDIVVKGFDEEKEEWVIIE